MSDVTPAATAKWRAATVRLLVALVLGLICYDMAAYRYGGQDATITQVIREASVDWLLIPVLAGLLFGHLFWSSWSPKKDSK